MNRDIVNDAIFDNKNVKRRLNHKFKFDMPSDEALIKIILREKG